MSGADTQVNALSVTFDSDGKPTLGHALRSA